jgi:hypothetical protein
MVAFVCLSFTLRLKTIWKRENEPCVALPVLPLPFLGFQYLPPQAVCFQAFPSRLDPSGCMASQVAGRAPWAPGSKYTSAGVA